MSQTMNNADIAGELQNKVGLSTLEPKELMQEPGRKGWQRAYVQGGEIIQLFLHARLISDIIVTHIPILIG